MDTTKRRVATRAHAVLAIALAAGITTVGCANDRAPDTRAEGAPVSVVCGPAERALVRPTIVNGVQGSQVTCVAATATAAVPVSADTPLTYDNGVPVATPTSGYVPAAYQYPVAAREPVAVSRPVYVQPARRTIAARRHVVSSKRSVGKSALIIGGSAGAGAGIGAAIGGKKGALIGALVGGGGATLWDQITRHTGGR